MHTEKDIPIAVAGYGAGAAARIVGLKLRTVQRWADQGLVPPSLKEAHGKGYRDSFSFTDLVALKTAARLKEKGLSLQAIKRALAFLRQYDSAASLANRCIVSDGADIFEKSGQEVRSLLRKPGQTVFTWVLDLGEIQQEIKRAIREAA
jgi:DNA-binding transcriptional MerR regulator